MLEHRDSALGGDPLDQAAPAARNDDVDHAGHGEHFADRGAVARRHELNTARGQARRREPAPQTGGDGARRMEALGAAAQDHRVARLEAQAAGVGGDVGARFVDHPDDPERHPHALDAEPVGPLPLGDHRADRIGESGDVVEAARHRLDAPRVERQAVDHGGAQVPRPGAGDVLGVGLKDLGARRANRVGRRRERRVLARRRRPGEDRGGGAGLLAQRGHAGLGRPGLDGLRCGHPHSAPSRPQISTKSSRWISSSRPR